MKTKKIRGEKIRKRLARQAHVRKGMARTDRAWLTVYRSSRHIYAQLVDPETGKTLATVSTRTQGVVGPDVYTGNVDAAKKVGAAIAAAAQEKSIQKVVFNRNGFLYHGRVKALAEAAREAGLQF